MLNADTQWRETLLQQTTEKTYRDAYRPWQLAESNLGGVSQADAALTVS